MKEEKTTYAGSSNGGGMVLTVIPKKLFGRMDWVCSLHWY
jgi:hypothetical protein